MRKLLGEALRLPSVSGQEGAFTQFIADWAADHGFEVDLWQGEEAELAGYRPDGRALAAARHIPLAGRPTLVIRLPGRGTGPSLMFNAHADVVCAPQPERWRFDPFGGVEAEGRFWGRGACDVKGPLVAALGAMLALRRSHPSGLAGDVLLELVPGEEDCVGLGTLTSVHRGYSADGLIVLEPTENQPRCASRAGCRFEITAHGRAVHGTVKWLGDDAIRTLRHVLDALDEIEGDWNDRNTDPLFASYPIARPITVDMVRGGEWQGMVCDRCTCAGYIELLPGDDLTVMQTEFGRKLLAILDRSGKHSGRVSIEFSEIYGGHRTDPVHPICLTAARVMREVKRQNFQGLAAGETGGEMGGGSPSASRIESARSGDNLPDYALAGFNSGCEAGLRAGLCGTPTLVWGPGSLAQAHAVDEWVNWFDVLHSATLFSVFANQWCGGN
jgi:acetylornithine deacetylase